MTTKKKIVTVRASAPTTEAVFTSYIGARFRYENAHYVVWADAPVWEFVNGSMRQVPGVYAVALIDPTKGIERIPYHTTPQGVLYRMGNVHANSHLSLPADRVRAILNHPDILNAVPAERVYTRADWEWRKKFPLGATDSVLNVTVHTPAKQTAIEWVLDSVSTLMGESNPLPQESSKPRLKTSVGTRVPSAFDAPKLKKKEIVS